MHDWIDASWAQAEEGGEGDAYVDFLVRTLKPEIDRRYRTLPDREHTGIGGSSMGGLIALHAALTHPDVFSKVMAMSTAVWFAEGGGPWLSDNRLISGLRTRALPRDVRFYLDVGTNERSRSTDPDVVDAKGERVSWARAYVEGSEAVADALVEGGVSAWNVKHVIEKRAEHDERAWARRFEEAVTWLYHR
jgi:predicted alpha/beta superfamily hydrolase